MKYITNFITNIITNIMAKLKTRDLPKPLGRWKIDYCNTKMSNKVDLSNEDHCGPCGQYSITKIPQMDNNLRNKLLDNNTNNNTNNNIKTYK